MFILLGIIWIVRITMKEAPKSLHQFQTEAKLTMSGRILDIKTDKRQLKGLDARDKEFIIGGGRILIDYSGNIERRKK